MEPGPARTFPGGRLVRHCAALALLPLLSGCVAALAVPAMTAAGALTERKHVRPQTETPTVEVPPALASVPTEKEPLAEVMALAALPPPTAANVANRAGELWHPFVNYALEQAAALRAGGRPRESALLSAEGISYLKPQRRPCRGAEPAVIVDLDSGPAVFSPASAGAPSPGLAEALARLREAGLVVLWISSADANGVSEIGDTLRRTGLDPEGRDPLLLVLSEDDRKQTMREEANEDVCVVAIAGDRRADFDELFDYLRNSDLAIGLDTLIGAGWFITPVPLAPAGAE